MINVLIIEHDPMVAELNKQYLGLVSGFKAIGHAQNADEAFEMLKDEDISLILLEACMPNISALTLLKKIRSLYPNIDIIMVTATKTTTDIQTALRFGVIDYLVKPFTFQRFRTALLSYKDRMRILSSTETLEQSVLDKEILSKNIEINKKAPKGIDFTTLAMVEKMLSDYTDEFAVSDILPKINLSRISLKKYIDHLQSIGKLDSHLQYLPIGRPVRKYTYNPNSNNDE